MSKYRYEDTIAAIATPIGEGGISVIRLSGPETFSIASGIFRPRKTGELHTFPSHTIHSGEIRKGGGVILDQVLVSIFRAPHSYTAEDVLEISSHGGIGVSKRILDLLIQKGARHAEPGEFTKRAFLNGRIDLPQAEAVLDLIKAKSDKSLEVAARQLTGHLSRKLKSIKEDLMQVYAHMEAYLDFPEEDLEVYSDQAIAHKLQAIQKEIERLIASFNRGSLLREGIVAVIVGKANVGKSSLFNALVERDHVLVSEYPGTTRDRIEESIIIDGITIRLVDTAGLALMSDHPLDQMGMERTRQVLKESDLYVFMVDGSETLSESDQAVFQELESDKARLIVVNKSDLVQKINFQQLKKMTAIQEPIQISTITREGFSQLEKAVSQSILEKDFEQEGEQITRLRHKNALGSSLNSLIQAGNSFQERKSLEFIIFDLKLALDALRELIGEVYSDDLLDVIFSNFCIGK